MISLPAFTQGQDPTAAAFDALASEYDVLWSDSFIGRLQRRQVWRELDTIFEQGDRILELGCGTGIDAVHLAELGIQVHATDISPEMLKAALRRVQGAGLSHRVSFELQPVECLSGISERGPFDGALSNFGVFNCVRDLDSAASGLARLVRAGGKVVICWMGRFCLWETVWYLVHAKPGKAFRRVRAVASGLSAMFKSGFELRVFYPSMSDMAAAFRKDFRMLSFRSVGLAVPPSYLDHWVSTKREAFEKLAPVDELLGRWPVLRGIGDHRLAVFIRKNLDSSG